MLAKINMRLLGGAFVVVVLLCAGIYFYAEWSNKRFASELGEPPQVTTTSEPIPNAEDGEILGVAQTTPVQPIGTASAGKNKKAVVPESDPTKASALANEEGTVDETETAESASEFDVTPLLSAFGMPEEVHTLLNEGSDAADFQAAETYLIGEYGQSPEVAAILDRLKQMSGGPVELDELTGLFEAWIQVLPEENRDTRRQLMDALTQLYQAQTSGGGSGEIRIEVHVEESVTVE